MVKKKTHYEDESGSGLKAEFSFTDVDGNQVTGVYHDWCICDLLDHLGYGYLYNEDLYPVRNRLMGSFNGIVDITKAIHITNQADGD